jgi:exodeoxyribonuclease VII large subunit
MDQTDSPSNAAEFSVFEISVALKRVVEDSFGNVRVRGEISGYRGVHTSGHAYFSLKDDRARIEAVVWRGSFSKLKFRPEEGMEVIATGKLTTFPGSSKYQIVIEQMEPAGAGALMALLEERKRRLAAEGLFDEGRKQLLPFLPKVIGVVTSPTGAVIRDILHRIADRFPLHVLVWPVKVQGEGSGDEVAAAVKGFNAFEGTMRPDVLIVARGGGSLEDLWGFNDEAVVRAVAASEIPVISAVGHETDWTLIDLAADVRAPTPTGAAEMAVPVKADLVAHLATLSARLGGGLSRDLERKRQAVRAASRALPGLDALLALPRRHFDELTTRLSRGLATGIERKRIRFIDGVAARLRPESLTRALEMRQRQFAQIGERNFRAFQLGVTTRRGQLDAAWRLAGSFSHQNVLERGFALVRDVEGKPMKRRGAVEAGAALEIEFADGRVNVREVGGGAAPVSKAKPKPQAGQGDLF